MRIKFNFLPILYVGDSIKNKSDKLLPKIRMKLQLKPEKAGVYLILVSSDPREQLDIISSKALLHQGYRGQTITPYGIAGSHEEACSLVQSMLDDCLSTTGGCNLKEFLTCSQYY